jgi:AbiU2
MSGALSADEAKAKHVLAMGDELGSLYDALWQQVAWLHRKWSEYVALFGTKESRVVLLNEVAPSFTAIVQDTLWEDVLLHIARLMDPPKSAGRSNLSLQSLANGIGHAQTKAQVESLVGEALVATEFCRDWRNRHIAHRDLRLALERGAEPLKPASRLKVREALTALAAILNAVSHHYLDSTTVFEFGARHGGAVSLLYVLDAGLHAERARHQRLKDGIYDSKDHGARDV